jgi:hypothetical protein
MNVKRLLIDHFDYAPENISLLTDETEKKPTRNNSLGELYKLLVQSHNENVDHIWISYSGHGTWTPDTNGDELDKKDELIVPLDFKMISDDTLHHIISLIQLKTKCMCLFDSCHSGTVTDLPCVYNIPKSVFDQYSTPDSSDAKDVLLISGCKDDQYSQEAWVGRSQGAMTTIFIYLLQKYDYKVSWKQLISEMNQQLELYGFNQRPRLSCNKLIDVDSDFSC